MKTKSQQTTSRQVGKVFYGLKKKNTPQLDRFVWNRGKERAEEEKERERD